MLRLTGHQASQKRSDPMCSQPQSRPGGDQGERVLARGMLELRSAAEPTCHVVEVTGELDLASVGLLEEEMGRALDTDAPAIVLDISQLRFIDSTGIQLLLRLQARSRRNGRRLRMLRGTAQVQRVLELTGADRLLPFLGVDPPPDGDA
jgi:anti-sigma B factor antagonist